MRPGLILAIAWLVAACTGADPTSAAGEAVVERVVDGDTIDVEVDGRHERVRLLGIDTPEIHVDEGPPECYGPEAAELTTGMLPVGTRVRLERDVVGRDDYGRLLAYVYLADGRMVNEEIVRRGYARVLVIAPNGVFRERFVAAARAADGEELGLWAACGG